MVRGFLTPVSVLEVTFYTAFADNLQTKFAVRKILVQYFYDEIEKNLYIVKDFETLSTS